MKIDVLTLFPEMLTGALEASIIKRAREAGVVDVALHNFRDWATDRHHTVDDAPFGGGPGMVLKPEPVFAAAEAIRATQDVPAPLVYLSPKGERFTQEVACELAAMPSLLLLCGRYEGLDQRVVDHLVDREISVGDYVLSGGEPACLVVLDAVIRLLPGALGEPASLDEESFSSGLLDTRSTPGQPNSGAGRFPTSSSRAITRPSDAGGGSNRWKKRERGAPTCWGA